MNTRENRSIAYIYDEMDPAEKLEFERDLKSDNNLLIEVESLKKISENLNKLEHIDPPAHVVESICNSARINCKGSGTTYWKTFLYSAAAVLLIGMTSGIFLMDNPSEESATHTESASVSGTPVFSQPVSSSSSTDNLTPWVDKNEVLYLHEQTGANNSTVLDSIKNNSFKKLTPVTDPALVKPYDRLQLTGSSN